MSLVSKKTWCPKCDSNLTRTERTLGTFYREMLVVYKCDDPLCRYEHIIHFRLNDKMRQRLREKRGGFGR